MKTNREKFAGAGAGNAAAPLRLNGTQLKLLAMLFMCIDHTGAILFPALWPVTVGGGSYSLLRIIGRFSFPIFAFLLSEGAVHTSNWKKYALRLLVMSAVSEPIYDMALHGSWWDWGNQNIMLTLLVGLLVIRADLWMQIKKPGIDLIPWRVCITGAGCLAAEAFGADYGLGGVLMITLLYYVRKFVWLQLGVLALVNAGFYEGAQPFAVFAWLFIALYDGKPGIVKNTSSPENLTVPKRFEKISYDWKNRLLRDGFYLFYPIHLWILWWVS